MDKVEKVQEHQFVLLSQPIQENNWRLRRRFITGEETQKDEVLLLEEIRGECHVEKEEDEEEE